MASCTHLEKFTTSDRSPVSPRSEGCEECLASGSGWVELRMCMECGHVGCCDSSQGRHATTHFRQTSHPVMRAFEPQSNWAWCYEHEQMESGIPTLPGETPSQHLDAPSP